MSREAQVVLGSRDEEGAGGNDPMQPQEAHVAAIHHGESARLEEQIIEPQHVVLASVNDIDASGNRATQIDLGMHFDSRLGLAEVRPGKKSERKIDRGGVQRIDRVLQFQAEIFSGIESSGFAHEGLGQVLPQSPVAQLVGVGQRRLGDRLTKTQMVKRFELRIQTRRDIAQSFAPCQSSKGHADRLPATP